MSAGELWFVKLPNGDVHHVTVDQLDMAFEAGHINADTLVLADGSSEWTRLGEAAGLDEEPAAAPAPAPYRAPAAQYHHQPAVASWSPTPAPVVRSVSVAPQVSRAPVSYAQPATPAASIRPVAFDLGSDLDLEMSYPRRGSRKGWVVAALALATMGGGVGFAATHGIALPGGGSGNSNVAAAAAVPVALPIAAPEPAPAPPPVVQQVQAPLGGALPSMESGLNPRFTDAQKEKLLQADKVRDDQTKSRQAAHYVPHTKYKSSSTFTKGGNKYDPLNSDL